MVSSRQYNAGDIVATIDVRVRPPNESCNILVSLLSLHITTSLFLDFTKMATFPDTYMFFINFELIPIEI